MITGEVLLFVSACVASFIYFQGACLHKWGKWERRVVREPFCVAESRQLRTCIKCGKVQDKFIHYGE